MARASAEPACAQLKARVVSHCLQGGGGPCGNTPLLDPEDQPCALFVDMDHFERLAKAAMTAFAGIGGASGVATMAFAVKACPLRAVLVEACRLGLGAECASIVEVKHALSCGFSHDRVVFDSPAKTKQDILFCLQHDIYMNLDSLDEIDRVAACISELDPEGTKEESRRVGLRINPQLGAGSILSTSTATSTSKFGCALQDHHDEILARFSTHKWLRALHCHVGSQGKHCRKSVVEKLYCPPFSLFAMLSTHYSACLSNCIRLALSWHVF